MMGTGHGSGESRAVDAARSAISSPLLEDLSIDGARGVLINITGGEDMTLFEVNEASTLVQEAAHEDANIIFGAVIEEHMPEEEMRVTVIATGLDDGHAQRGRDFERDWHGSESDNVTRLQQEVRRDGGSAPTAEAGAPSHAQTDSKVHSGRPLSDSLSGIDSPFAEDEFDVPAFIRRRSDEDEEHREASAFLRRAQD